MEQFTKLITALSSARMEEALTELKTCIRQNQKHKIAEEALKHNLELIEILKNFKPTHYAIDNISKQQGQVSLYRSLLQNFATFEIAICGNLQNMSRKGEFEISKFNSFHEKIVKGINGKVIDLNEIIKSIEAKLNSENEKMGQERVQNAFRQINNIAEWVREKVEKSYEKIKTFKNATVQAVDDCKNKISTWFKEKFKSKSREIPSVCC
jgi:hypothetical protein